MYIKEFNVIYTEKKTDEYRLYICKKSLENQLYRIFELADRNKIAERRGKFSHLVIALKYMPENEKAIPKCKSEYYDRIKKILLKIAVTAAVLAGILIIIFKLMAEYDTDKLEYDKIDSLGGIDLID